VSRLVDNAGMEEVFGYKRVSGKGQVEGDGPERQQEAIEAFCRAHGLKLVEVAFDGGVSGTVDGMERPEFARLLEMCQNGTLGHSGAIVVERLDRLARDLMVQEVLLAECRKNGVAVYAADHGELVDLASCEDDPTRKVCRQIMGAIAEFEKTSTVLKLRAARQRAKAKDGRCEGRKPYGFNECERSVLQIMLERFAEYEDYQDAADWLNNLGMTTRSGTLWNRGTVWAIIKRNSDALESYKLDYAAAVERARREGEEQSAASEHGEGSEHPVDGGGEGGADDATGRESQDGRGYRRPKGKRTMPVLQHNPCQKDSVVSFLKFSSHPVKISAVAKHENEQDNLGEVGPMN